MLRQLVLLCCAVAALAMPRQRVAPPKEEGEIQNVQKVGEDTLYPQE